MESSIEQADNTDYDNDFLCGISCLCESDYKQARHFFLKAVYNNYSLGRYYAVYQSYLGLSDVLINYKEDALSHHYHSTDTITLKQPEVQINLACAEFIKGDRRRAFQAMDKLNDLILSPKNAEEINSFFSIIGTRQQKNNGSLKRNSVIHKYIGKLFRKKEKINNAGYIEIFIRETANNRYNVIA